ncbi:MAG: exosortase C-terminal domain/associated protein EpsI [Myxococcota bacterium]
MAAGLAGALVLLGFACRELLGFQPETNLVLLSGEVEEFFFEPSDSSPWIVLGLCAWLVWRRRARLGKLFGAPAPFLWTAVLFAAAAGIFVWSLLAGAPDLQAIALIPGLLGAAHALCGPAGLRVVALPAAVLLFAVPIPAPLTNAILWKLQIWTAGFTAFLIEILGFDVLLTGDRLIMSDGYYQIIETCSGMRSIETLGMLSVLMVELFRRRGGHAVALLAASPFVAFLINGFRCVGLVFNPHADISSIHNLQGVVMLLGGVLLLYAIDGLLERVWKDPGPVSSWERAVRGAGAPLARIEPRFAGVFAFCLALFALSWLPPFERPDTEPAAVAGALPLEFGDWQGTDIKVDWLFLGKAKFRQTLHRRYEAGQQAVDVFVGQADLDNRVRSYLSPKVAYPGSGWTVEREETHALAGRPATFRTLRLGSRRMLVAHWFEDSPGVLEETTRSLLALDATPAAREELPVAVRLSTPLLTSKPIARDRARARLEQFAGALGPALKEIGSPRGV